MRVVKSEFRKSVLTVSIDIRRLGVNTTSDNRPRVSNIFPTLTASSTTSNLQKSHRHGSFFQQCLMMTAFTDVRESVSDVGALTSLFSAAIIPDIESL